MILETMVRPKRYFNVTDKKDITAAKDFFANHRWTGGCPFILEYPYVSVPDMLRDKLIHKALGIKYDRRHHWNYKNAK
jgi:hypothetical protein